MNAKKITNTLFLAFLFLGMTANAAVKKNAFVAGNTVSLADFLNDISETHEVFFTYNPKVISGSNLNPEEYRYNTLGKIITKLKVKTKFNYEYLGNKYYVVHPKMAKKAVVEKINSTKGLGLVTVNDLSIFQNSISGTVTDQDGNPLAGVNIVEKGTTNGTTTDFDGNYIITVESGATLVYSYIGFETKEEIVGERTSINVQLSEGVQLEEFIAVGSRSPKRTSTDTAVPVDVIDVADVTTQSGQIEINQLLQYVAPSFNANKQSGSDGADHIDPATLRGLGPDQTLVLVNGKRRHQSSLINIFGTRGRGNSGTDLNAIPATAIKRIEILRDGAAAQYGSDAIAGVINIVLNDNVGEVTGLVSYGAYNTNADGDFVNGTPNTDGNRLDTDKDGNQIGDDQNFDGGSVKVAANYGVALGEDGGFANFTTEFINKEKTLRPGYDFRRGFGEAAIRGFNFMVNAEYPITENTEIYAFGGRNYRDTDAFAFTRNGGERVVTSIYPNGFTPRITSTIIDNSVAVGVRSELKSGWNMDISNSFGKNNFHYFIEGTLNASLVDASPTEFDAGGHTLSQNTTNLDFSKYFEDVLEGLNIAFGAEYRTENFSIFAGEEGSYGTFDTNGLIITNPATQTQPEIDGTPRPGGSQGFPGYSPANEVDRSRNNISLYADTELDVTESFLISAAGRFESYSDFGSTINGKFATRIKASDNVNFRASVSTGFRAPSLAQIYYNLQFTDFQGGVASESLLAPNNSPVTQAFRIEQLKEETAFNSSLGLTANFGDFSATVDGYYIDIQDRIVLTGTFDASGLGINVSDAQFFANGVDTESFGVDVVLSWTKRWDDSKVSATLAGNINDMEIKDIKNGSLDQETFFGAREQAFLLASAPDSKFTLNLNYAKTDKFNVGLAFTRFSEISLVDFSEDPTTPDIYDPKITTDLTIGLPICENLKLSLGSNNLFNIYPDQQNDENTESGGYWDSVQMGFGGAFYYARLGFNF